MKAMQAQQYGAAEVLSLQETDSLQPAAEQVLIAIEAAGVNPVDTYILAGTNNYTASFPHTPGKDGAGTVLALGEGVSQFSVGQRVYCAGSLSGTSAEQALCSASQVYPLGDALSFAEGACIGTPYATAWRSLFIKGQAKAAETVFIHGGSGAVGIAALQLAKAAGCRVFASAGSEAGMALLERQGADLVVNHHDEAHFEQIEQAGGADVILEMLANVNLGKDLPLLKLRGRVIVIGNRGTVEINPRGLMAKDAAVHGMALAHADAAELKQIHAALYAGMQAGFVKPVIEQSFALQELGQAHQAVMRSGALGNIVVEV